MQGRMQDSMLECLVDTGATVNILSVAWWDAHGEEKDLLPAGRQVISADGRPLKLYGPVRGGITLDGREWPVVFELSDISSEAILGSVFLRENQFLVDMARERLMWEPGTLEEAGSCRVMSCRTAVIAPGEEALLDNLAGNASHLVHKEGTDWADPKVIIMHATR